MHKNVSVPTPYGPLTAEVVSCDGPGCGSQYLEEHLVGWHQLSPQGMEVAAFGHNPDPLDFCSMACLKASIDMMTGSS